MTEKKVHFINFLTYNLVLIVVLIRKSGQYLENMLKIKRLTPLKLFNNNNDFKFHCNFNESLAPNLQSELNEIKQIKTKLITNI